MNKTKGFLSLLSAGLIFGSFGILIRILNQQLTSFQQIFFRNFVSFLLATLIILILKRKVSFKNASLLKITLFGVSLPLTIVLYTLSILKTKIIITIASLYIGSIVFSLLLGIIFFKEKITFQKILSIFFAIVGLIFFTSPFSLASLNIGLIYGVLSGFMDVISNSFKKHLSGKLDRFVLIAIQMFGGIIISLILMFYSKTLYIPQMSSQTIFVGLLFGLLLLTINYLLLVGFQNFDLNLGTIVLSSELAFASIFAFIFYKELPTRNELIAVFFIILSIIISHLNFKKIK